MKSDWKGRPREPRDWPGLEQRVGNVSRVASIYADGVTRQHPTIMGCS